MPSMTLATFQYKSEKILNVVVAVDKELFCRIIRELFSYNLKKQYF